MPNRQDDKYIYDEDNQPNHLINFASFVRLRWPIVLVLVLAIVSVVLIILRFTKLKDWRPEEFVGVATLIVAVFAILGKSYSSFSEKKHRIDASLDISVLNHTHVKVTACVHNAGTIKIEPFNISIFIDAGICNPRSKRYEFPFLLKHEIKDGKRKYDCILSEYCQTNKEFYPKDLVDSYSTDKKFEKTFRTCYRLAHLSEESILYIGAGEDFSEDVILELDEPGAYRAILIVTAKDKACDCICRSKQFFIEDLVK